MKTILRLSLLLSLFVRLLSFTACTDNENNGNDEEEHEQYVVAEAQLIADYSQYNISNLSWEVRGEYEVANFIGTTKTTDVAITAWYALSVDLESATRKMDVEAFGLTVPPIIAAAFVAPYNDPTLWIIDDIELENRYNGSQVNKVYEVELESVVNAQLEAELYFDAVTGELLYSIETLGEGDDDDDDRIVVSADLEAAVKAVYPSARIIDAEQEDSSYIEVKILQTDNVNISEVELVFSAENIFELQQYETTYSKLDSKFAAVTAWFADTNNMHPIPTDMAEVEVAEVADGKTLTDDGLTFSSQIEIEYESGRGEYEVEFLLDAKNVIIRVDKDDDLEYPVGKYTNGTFILNQGRWGVESDNPLNFIGDNGVFVEKAYMEANGSMLPSGTQDLFIEDNEIFFACSEGLLVADANTLKYKKTYTAELNLVVGDLPLRVAVLDGDAFVLITNYGNDSRIVRIDLESGVSANITGTAGAIYGPKMVVADDKLYAVSATHILVMEEGENSATTIEIAADIKGVNMTVAADDDYIWLVGGSATRNAIMKLDTDTNMIEYHDIAPTVSPEFVTPSITALGNKIYFTSSESAFGATAVLYVHDFVSKQTTMLIDNYDSYVDGRYTGGNIYGGIAINPATSELYMNVIKGNSEPQTNDLLLFNVSGATPTVSKSYQNKTRFSNGTFFTSNY